MAFAKRFQGPGQQWATHGGYYQSTNWQSSVVPGRVAMPSRPGAMVGQLSSQVQHGTLMKMAEPFFKKDPQNEPATKGDVQALQQQQQQQQEPLTGQTQPSMAQPSMAQPPAGGTYDFSGFGGQPQTQQAASPPWGAVGVATTASPAAPTGSAPSGGGFSAPQQQQPLSRRERFGQAVDKYATAYAMMKIAQGHWQMP